MSVEPVSEQRELTALDVVFVHGLDGDPVKTWSRDPATYWPKWLAEDNPEVAVWAVGYDASSSRWKSRGRMGMLDRGVSILADLHAAGIGERPLCLVGHSLGGLMIKRLLVHAAGNDAQFRTVAENAVGVVFLATPHNGSGLARVLRAIKVARPSRVVGDLIEDADLLVRLNSDYRNWAAAGAVRHRVFRETHQHKFIRALVVDERSADPGLPLVTPVGVDADHARICKPVSRQDVVYATVNRFVADLLGRPVRAQDRQPAPTERVHGSPRPDTDHTKRKVFEASGWAKTLRALYPRFELLEYEGASFPIWAKAADVQDWDCLDAPLGSLSPGPLPGEGNYPPEFHDKGLPTYEKILASANERSRFDGATFALERVEIDHGRIRIHARHGTYFHSLATSELLDSELIDLQAEQPDQALELSSLPRRQWLHDVAGGERVVLDGRRRAAALSVAATMLIAQPDGTYRALLARRSSEVATHPLFSHVAPAGILGPINAERRNQATEFSVRTCILREYGEELFGYKDLEQGAGLMARDVPAVPPVRELLAAEREGRVVLKYCGVSVPLLTLRPEISVLILVRDPSWFESEIERADASDHWFALNWEYEQAKNKDLDAVFLPLDGDFRVLDRSLVRPSVMVPHAAAALHLSTMVARTLTRGAGA